MTVFCILHRCSGIRPLRRCPGRGNPSLSRCRTAAHRRSTPGEERSALQETQRTNKNNKTQTTTQHESSSLMICFLYPHPDDFPFPIIFKTPFVCSSLLLLLLLSLCRCCFLLFLSSFIFHPSHPCIPSIPSAASAVVMSGGTLTVTGTPELFALELNPETPDTVLQLHLEESVLPSLMISQLNWNTGGGLLEIHSPITVQDFRFDGESTSGGIAGAGTTGARLRVQTTDGGAGSVSVPPPSSPDNGEMEMETAKQELKEGKKGKKESKECMNG